MSLEPEVEVYSSFDRSGAKGLKCILASLLTVLRVVYTIVRPTSKDLP